MSDSTLSDHSADQHQRIRDAFKQQAAGWGQRQDSLAAAAAQLDLQPQHRALDVASGSGLFAQAIAPQVARTVSADITPEMLLQARRKQLPRHSLVLAAAEAMPHPSDCFDRVVTRYSLHHMHDPAPVLQEIYRVCRSEGWTMIIDIVSPEDPATAEHYNHLERLRDPSHTTALARSALETLVRDTGFNLAHSSVNPLGEMDVEGWFDLAQTPYVARRTVLAALEAELSGQRDSGFNPLYRDGRLKIVHTVATIIGIKA